MGWQDCQQEAECSRKESLWAHQGMASCNSEGEEGLGCKGPQGDQKGHSILQEGKGVLSVNASCFVLHLCQFLFNAACISSGCGVVHSPRAQVPLLKSELPAQSD